jgi:hypothetical protein
MYGAANVVDQEVDAGEGETDLATILFPSDPQRSIEIFWKDPDKKTAPSSATIRGKRAGGMLCMGSRWELLQES